MQTFVLSVVAINICMCVLFNCKSFDANDVQLITSSKTTTSESNRLFQICGHKKYISFPIKFNNCQLTCRYGFCNLLRCYR